MKTFPKVGDQGYLRRFNTGRYYIDIVKDPYTVIAVNNNEILVQEARCIFPTPCYYNTLPIAIEPDTHGEVIRLTWHPKREKWGTPGPDSDFPKYFVFEEGYKYTPYLD